MLIKIHKSYRDVVAISDAELLSKEFQEGENQLILKKAFYDGDDASEEQALKIMQKMSDEDATFNIVGEKSVALALKAGIIEQNGIKKIQDIPFALVLL